MLHKVYCVYDSKVEAYMSPFLMQSKGQALRAFTDTIADEKSLFAKHPEDYTLFEIAEFDDLTGNYIPYAAKVNVAGAWELTPRHNPDPIQARDILGALKQTMPSAEERN